jgi:hypothetical protein
MLGFIVSIVLFWIVWRRLLRPCLTAPVYVDAPPPPPQIVIHLHLIVAVPPDALKSVVRR